MTVPLHGTQQYTTPQKGMNLVQSGHGIKHSYLTSKQVQESALTIGAVFVILMICAGAYVIEGWIVAIWQTWF